MTPAEEQILRNQVVILGMLSALMMVPDDPELIESMITHMQHGASVLNETRRLLQVESQQGQTVHAYTP